MRLFYAIGVLVLGWAATAVAADDRSEAVLLECELPGHDPVLLDAVSQAVGGSYSVSRIGLDVLLEPDTLSKRAPDLLILPNASVIPAHATPAVDKFLRGGGDLIALRTPLALKPPILIGGKWVDKQDYLREQAAVAPPHVMYDLAEAFKGWDRVTNHPEWKTTAEAVRGQPGAGLNAVHVKIPQLEGWDTYTPVAVKPVFPAGHTLTVFAARGTATTSSLAVEWEERDGSRWIATVPLTKEYRRIVIAPEEFRYWMSNPKRGGAGDCFKPDNAAVLKIGLAFSHTGPVPGPHEFWIGPVGTAARTSEFDQLIGDFALPALDTICPSYKFFDSNDVTRLTRSAMSSMDLESPLQFSVPTRIRSSHPRPGGGGFNKGRAWRWIPLLDARAGEHAHWRGSPATLLIQAEGPYKGGAWLSIGVDEEAWYSEPNALALIGRAAERIREGVFLIDGGADKYTYFEDQEMILGATIVNIKPSAVKDYNCTVSLTNRDDETDKQAFHWTFSLGPGEVKQVSTTYRTAKWPKEGYACGAVLSRPGQKVGWVDVVSHPVHVWKPKPLAERKYMTVANGNFMLDGKRWRAHGINYMPSSGIGTEDQSYFEEWTGRRSYDPHVIQRDLENIKRLGYNAVSVFTAHHLIDAQNMVDLIRRCEGLGLKVNLSLRPGTPMQFQWPKMREMIEGMRLAENDTVFALDLAWEPHFGRHGDRAIWDRDWEAWIVERYGSVENAEKDWKFAVPRTADGKVTNPADSQTVFDGEWRVMVAAYRRFLDTLLYKKYGEARRLVRTIDPHHFVSFRMTEAGNPTFHWDAMLPYDFPYLVHAVDFLAPEAYGRIGDWESVKPGWFELEYGRWADPAKPFIWAEQGVHTWATSTGGNPADLLERQAAFYRAFYRMMIASGADGIFSWWYPGGFRWNENSDYGIINPDGSDRPVTKVIREMARPFLEGPDPKPIDTWLEFDRDAHPVGIAGAYDAVKDEFWKAIDAGKVPGLRTAGTGTTSRDCPPLAVGNTPMNGSNPPKYLDAAFDAVEIQGADGTWRAIEPKSTVSVGTLRPGSPLRLRATVTNLGEAEWIAESGNAAAPESVGAVFFRAVAGGRAVSFPLARNLRRGESLERAELTLSVPAARENVEVSLELECSGRGSFGERFRFSSKE